MPKSDSNNKTKSYRPRPNTRANLIQGRVTNDELTALTEKALLYFDGNMSALVVAAALAYRPVKKGPGVKV